MNNASDVANNRPLPLPVWWRPGQDRGPLIWALQALLSILCTRWHIGISLLNRPSKFSIVDVVILFTGKVISLDTSDIVVFSGVCAKSSLSRTLLLSLDKQLQGYKVCVRACAFYIKHLPSILIMGVAIVKKHIVNYC